MFHFSLQTVLEVRERFEKIKYKEYSAELMAKQDHENEKANRLAALQGAAEKADRTRVSSISALPLQLHDRFRERLLDEIATIDRQLRDQDEVVELKRKELVEARRSHRALEILRDKEFARYRSDEMKQERAVMDEVATNYYIFK